MDKQEPKEYIIDNVDSLVIDNNFKKLLIIYCDYLKNNYNFTIPTSTLVQFFKSQTTLDLFNEKEFRYTLKCMLCKNKDQYDIYDELHTNFFTGKIQFNEILINDNVKIEARERAQQFLEQKKLLNKSLEDTKWDQNINEVYLNHKELVEKQISSLKINKKAKNIIKQLFKQEFSLLEESLNTGDENKDFELRKDIESGLNSLMIDALLDNDLTEITDLILALADELNNIYKRLDTQRKEYAKELEKATKDIEKILSINSRIEFIEGHNAVKNHLDILNKNIEKLSLDDYVMLSNYIKANASKFKTRISKNMKKDKSRIFDYRATIKKSMKTDGVPLELIYKKPKINKVKIVCILDISGSCIKPAKTMLNFIYELASVFKGGVRSFVFVKHLAEVSNLFETNTILTAVEKSIVAVPNKGSYSDYNYAFSTFNENYINCIDKNTIVLYLGDARNNNNPSGEDFVKRVQNKAKSLIWLNTEPKAKWNRGDSIMHIYEKYMDQVYEIGTVEDIIDFLNTFNV